MTPAEERHLDIMLGNLLRTGVILAAAVVLTGAVLYLAAHGGEHPSYATLRGEPADLRTVRGVVSDVGSFRGRGVIQLGLLLLIATPVARVAFSAYAFTRLRDRPYVVITLIVLGLLFYSLFGAH